jgi:hypothetical protein
MAVHGCSGVLGLGVAHEPSMQDTPDAYAKASALRASRVTPAAAAIGGVLQADLVSGIGGFLHGELLTVWARQLIDESLAREGVVVEVVLGGADCLRLPVLVQLVDGPGGVFDLVALAVLR